MIQGCRSPANYFFPDNRRNKEFPSDPPKKEIEFLTNSNEEQKKQVRLLEEKIKLLKIIKATEIKEGAADAKLKINELVREIDKCIGLMNL